MLKRSPAQCWVSFFSKRHEKDDSIRGDVGNKLMMICGHAGRHRAPIAPLGSVAMVYLGVLARAIAVQSGSERIGFKVFRDDVPQAGREQDHTDRNETRSDIDGLERCRVT